jgi:hypothetical protein
MLVVEEQVEDFQGGLIDRKGQVRVRRTWGWYTLSIVLVLSECRGHLKGRQSEIHFVCGLCPKYYYTKSWLKAGVKGIVAVSSSSRARVMPLRQQRKLKRKTKKKKRKEKVPSEHDMVIPKPGSCIVN